MTIHMHPGMREFNRIFKECSHIYHDIALKLGLSDSGFDILYTICEIGDGCLQKNICEATLLSKQTIHSSVRKLEKDGYLLLKPGKGRDVQIFLTKIGRASCRERVCSIV